MKNQQEIMQKTLLASAAIFGAIAVISGAFGSHSLKGQLSEKEISTYEIAVKYLFYHTLAIFAAVFLFFKNGNSLSLYAGWLFVAGIVLFSGSLFLLSTKSLLNFSWNWLGPITPIGGLCFIIGWVLMLISILNTHTLK